MATRPLVYLVGSNMHDRQALCQAAGDLLRVEAACSLAELTPQAVPSVDAFLAWDQGETIPQLKDHLSILAHRAPIIAIAERPSVRQIARGLLNGAVDFLEWPCNPEALLEAVETAVEATARLLPLRERAHEARHILERLSKRERQVLTAMAQGMSSQKTAELLQTDPRTVEIHRRELLTKIEVQHSAEAIRLELEASLAADCTKPSDWMAPWLLDKPLRSTG